MHGSWLSAFPICCNSQVSWITSVMSYLVSSYNKRIGRTDDAPRINTCFVSKRTHAKLNLGHYFLVIGQIFLKLERNTPSNKTFPLDYIHVKLTHGRHWPLSYLLTALVFFKLCSRHNASTQNTKGNNSWKRQIRVTVLVHWPLHFSSMTCIHLWSFMLKLSVVFELWPGQSPTTKHKGQ